MSRTSEQTLPNVMLEKGLFDDLKVLDLLETFGCIGFTIYVSLLFKIADDKGYYTQMTPSLVVSIQRDIGSKWISREKVIEVINFLAQCDLISSSLLEKGVLTSVGIQRRYLSVKRKSRATGFSTEKYWLLDETQADNPIEYSKDEIERNKANKCNNKADKCNNNPDIKKRVSITGNKSSSTLLPDDDYKELCEKIGKGNCDYYLERVKTFKAKNPQAGFSVKATILKWYREDGRKEEQRGTQQIDVITADTLNEIFDGLKSEDL